MISFQLKFKSRITLASQSQYKLMMVWFAILKFTLLRVQNKISYQIIKQHILQVQFSMEIVQTQVEHNVIMVSL